MVGTNKNFFGQSYKGSTIAIYHFGVLLTRKLPRYTYYDYV